MNSFFKFFSKAQNFLLTVGICISVFCAAPLEASSAATQEGESVIFEDVSWQPMRLTTDFGDCVVQFPGQAFSGVEEEVCFAQSQHNSCVYIAVIMAEKIMDMPDNVSDFVAILQSELDEESADFGKQISRDIQIVELNDPNVRYAVDVTIEEDGVFLRQRYCCSRAGFGYQLVVMGQKDDILWHFFDTLKILK